MNLNTSLKPTRAAMNPTNATVDAIRQGRKYGWSRRYANFPKVFGQRSAGLENTPPMVGLEWRQWEKSYSHSQDTSRDYSANTPHNYNVSKCIRHICFVRYLECSQCQILHIMRLMHSPRRSRLLKRLIWSSVSNHKLYPQNDRPMVPLNTP